MNFLIWLFVLALKDRGSLDQFTVATLSFSDDTGLRDQNSGTVSNEQLLSF